MDVTPQVEAVREGIAETVKLSTLSYNHPTWWLQKSQPDRWFHMEVRGDALVTRLEEVEKVYEGGMLHLEVGHEMMFGMLNGIYRSPQQVIEKTLTFRENFGDYQRQLFLVDHAGLPLQTVLEQPFGQVLLTAIALGIAAYGLFCFARAKHLSR